ncbi:zinc finger protein [Colletotrichum incanum]|uniref:Zinc finger protein n=1 Tax=Colletotrichum incanum TaxID=1573173 RepID=A0A161Y758_COLIC|nr:zinc finger protein [Colletotrichum incanum]
MALISMAELSLATPSQQGMRTIYKRVATPQMMYACLWWSNGGWGEKGYTKRTLQRLQSLLVKAARRTSGAYRAI